MLNAYITQVRQLLKDPNQQTFFNTDLIPYINESREQLALDGECVRFLWQFDDSQSITNYTGTVTAGSNLITALSSTTNLTVGMLVNLPVATLRPTTVITAVPPTTAAGTVQINVPALGNLGPGAAMYFTPPLQTVAKQENYNYSTSVFTSLGYQRVIQVKNISVNWGGINGSNNLRLTRLSWSKYNAFYGFQGPNQIAQPYVWSEYGTAAYMRPIPSAAYPMQFDTICSPINLIDDTTIEVIPPPFQDAIKYHAAYLALLQAQRHKDAEGMFNAYDKYAKRARSFVSRNIVPNIYM